MTEIQPDLPEGLRALLHRAPYAVFVAVSGADARIDRHEIARFEEALTHPAYQVLRRYRDPEADGTDLVQDLLRPDADPYTELDRLAGWIKAMLAPAETLAIKHALARLGVEIAEASGGGPLGLGDKVSKQERVALQAIRLALKLD
jgi:hypothetical protein